MINLSSDTHIPSQQGVSGLRNSHRSVVEAANELVLSGKVERVPAATTDIVEPVVTVIEEQHVFDATAQMIKAEDQAVGSLLNTKV